MDTRRLISTHLINSLEYVLMDDPTREEEDLLDFLAELRRYRDERGMLRAKHGDAYMNELDREFREEEKRRGVKYLTEDDPMHPLNVRKRRLEAGTLWKSPEVPPPRTL
jgi:hypothetical protein